MAELTPEVLLYAYANGYFPMADSRTGQVEWYTADPRAIIPLDPFHVPRRFRRFLNSAPFTYSRDRDFEAVIAACAHRYDTWINDDIIEAYTQLYRLGRAHSVEVWQDDRLVGGLYGVHLGGAFFGESMFHREDGASKAALVHLGEHLIAGGFRLLEVQMITPTTAQFGAAPIGHREYLPRLRAAIAARCEWEKD